MFITDIHYDDIVTLDSEQDTDGTLRCSTMHYIVKNADCTWRTDTTTLAEVKVNNEGTFQQFISLIHDNFRQGTFTSITKTFI